MTEVDASWNVMAHGDAREGKRRGNWRMEWVASTLHTTSEHGVSSTTTDDAHTLAASSRLNWRPRRFKWNRPFRRKTKSSFCACANTFQLVSTSSSCGHRALFHEVTECDIRSILRSECGGTRWRTGGEVKGKLANGVSSQYSHTTSERGVSSITNADAHTSAASSRLNWLAQRFKWTRPFRRKTKSGFCACAIRFRTSCTIKPDRHSPYKMEVNGEVTMMPSLTLRDRAPHTVRWTAGWEQSR